MHEVEDDGPKDPARIDVQNGEVTHLISRTSSQHMRLSAIV